MLGLSAAFVFAKGLELILLHMFLFILRDFLLKFGILGAVAPVCIEFIWRTRNLALIPRSWFPLAWIGDTGEEVPCSLSGRTAPALPFEEGLPVLSLAEVLKIRASVSASQSFVSFVLGLRFVGPRTAPQLCRKYHRSADWLDRLPRYEQIHRGPHLLEGLLRT